MTITVVRTPIAVLVVRAPIVVTIVEG